MFEWFIQKKSVRAGTLLVPLSEALVLPIFVERANAEASRRICVNAPIARARAPVIGGELYIST